MVPKQALSAVSTLVAASLGACFVGPDPGWVKCMEGTASACTPAVCESLPPDERPAECAQDASGDAATEPDLADACSEDQGSLPEDGAADPGPADTGSLSCRHLDDQCNVGVRNPGGVCEVQPVNDGADCADGDPCTKGDSCVAGVCSPGPPPPCSDDLACTADACVADGPSAYWCSHTPTDSACYLDNLCYTPGAPNLGNSCLICDPAAANDAWTPVQDGTLCVDGVCVAGSCVSVPEGMVLVPGGPFDMGCNDPADDCLYENASPYHPADVPTFAIDMQETTADEYKSCVTDGACTEPSTVDGLGTFASVETKLHPVNYADWSQAEAYCSWGGKRLCSEAEWEKAARGTDGRKYPWDETVATCTYAILKHTQLDGCGTSETWPVGAKPAGNSPYGAMDMIGNVSEWVEDCWHDDFHGAPADGSAWVDDASCWRVAKGGSFQTASSYIAVWDRWSHYGTFSAPTVGVRCCLTL